MADAEREVTYFRARIPVVVRILLMLGDLLRKLLLDLALAHLLTHAWIELAHLATLAHTIAQIAKVLRSLNSTSSRARPHCQRLQFSRARSAMLDESLSFGLAMRDKRL